jgi:hypothetical protein
MVAGVLRASARRSVPCWPAGRVLTPAVRCGLGNPQFDKREALSVS